MRHANGTTEKGKQMAVFLCDWNVWNET